ncbi:MAG: ATP-binding cassette domain-containing protein [Saprospiraceae bacterium]|nr:ATP-binding cassette domain-containing protein [Saprospiraceae bacterium]
MSNSILQLRDVSFAYTSNEFILNGMSMHVPEGSIYGFLGANGAGKTTTFKAILGLLKGYSGNIDFQGSNIRTTYPKYLAKIGTLIEAPSIYDHLDAFNNLKIWSNYYGQTKNRICEILELVKLENLGSKKAGRFSTGMRQRLGIAIALLHDPNVLILDEPTNGLDPFGVEALRGILFDLNKQGKTIVVSSHILSEIEKTANHLGILKDGKMLFEGTKSELHNLRNTNLEVKFTIDSSAKLETLKDIHSYRIISDQVIEMHVSNKNEIPMIVKYLIENDINIYAVNQKNIALQDLFLSINNTQN